MSNITDVPMIMVLLSYFCFAAPTYGQLLATKKFEIDGLPNFLRYGAPIARLGRKGPSPDKLQRNKSENIDYMCFSMIFFMGTLSSALIKTETMHMVIARAKVMSYCPYSYGDLDMLALSV